MGHFKFHASEHQSGGGDEITMKSTSTYVIASSTSSNNNSADYVCDGTADDVQIQAAIDALPTNGGKIVLLDGTFNLNAAVSIRGGLWIDGMNPISTILAYQSSGNFNMFEYSSSTDQVGVLITNLRANGGGTGTTGSFIDTQTSTGELWDVHLINIFLWNFGTDPAADIKPAWGFRADRLIVEGGFGTGINISSTGDSQDSGAIINRCKIKVGDASGNCDAIIITDSKLCLVQGNELGAGTAKYGVQLINSDQISILGNTFLGGGNDDGNGILVDGTSDGNLIMGNIMNGASVGGTAITINSGATENIISENLIALWTTEITNNGTNTLILGNQSGSIAATRLSTFPYAVTCMGILKAESQFVTPKYTCTTTLDWDNGNVQYIVLANGAQTFTFANALDGAHYRIYLKQPASGAAGTVTWPGEVAWAGGSAPTLTATNSKVDIVEFDVDVTNSKYYGTATLNY